MGTIVVALLAAKADGSPCDYDEINLKMNQLRRKLRQTLRFLFGKLVLDGDVLSFNPSKLAQFLPERLQRTALPEAVLLSRKPMRKIFPACCAEAPAQPKAIVKAIAKIPIHFRFWILDFRLFTEIDSDRIIFLTAFLRNPKSKIENPKFT